VLLEGRFEVKTPIDRAWDFLNDAERLSSCMPGVEQAKQLDAQTFSGKISASVGPVSGTFTFRARILESRPPREMIVKIDGVDSVTGSNVEADVQITLQELSPRATEIAYSSDVQLKGRLAILGDMVLRATAGVMLEEFARRLKKRLDPAS
jgi:carbon monoxide dehydrogenase subunit G